jgi:hypothetical protein
VSRSTVAGLVAGLAVAPAMLGAGGCSAGAPARPGTPVVRLAWHELSLPSPPGPAGRIAVRDATACAGTWYVVGAVIGPDLATRPAAWASTDGHTWHSLAVAPTAYYARRNILTAVACRDGRIAAIGSRSGGAHGIPRVSSWYQRGDGALVDAVAPYTLFGGSQAVDVGRLGAGPRGWVIAGDRTSGAAVWTSPDATRFTLHDRDPALASDRFAETSAVDVVADDHGWTVVGRAEVSGRAGPVPMAWTSPDGVRWSREQVPPASAEYADLQRVLALGDRLVAVGLRGEQVAVWWRDRNRWRVGPALGPLDPRRRSAPFVSGVAAAGAEVLATASDGSRFTLWSGRPGGPFAEVRTPMRPTVSGDHQLTVASDGASVLLLADDGSRSRLWLAHWATRGR